MSNIDKILVVNSGSSSLKYMLFSMKNETMLCKGLVERIGAANANLVYQPSNGEKQATAVQALNHGEAFEHVCHAITNPKDGVLKSLSEIDAVGHRVLHGGMEFTKPVKVNDAVKAAIRKCFDLGPLHNPANLTGIEACEEKMKGVPNVAVFDTGFHMSMPEESFLYAIPLDLYEKYGIRKYGFHGTSHKYITETAAEVFQKPLDELNIITCHLGNGSSLAAIKGGKVFDTTMGLTPLQGLIMGTRSGDVDPAVCFFLGKKGYSPEDLDTLLNKKSGLLAIGGTGSGDMRDLCNAVKDGNPQAKIALDMFAHRIVFYIGGYAALLGHIDGIVFAGGIGENSDDARKAICDRLTDSLGIKLDESLNRTTHGSQTKISADDSKLPVWVIPTNEELMIARETLRIVNA